MAQLFRAVLAAVLVATLWVPAAQAASQTCVAKCADEESACIKRTNNKGQCGKQANTCTAKCK